MIDFGLTVLAVMVGMELHARYDDWRKYRRYRYSCTGPPAEGVPLGPLKKPLLSPPKKGPSAYSVGPSGRLGLSLDPNFLRGGIWELFLSINAERMLMIRYFLIGSIVLAGCASWRLPNRAHPNCKIPWENRKTCISDRNCGPDEICAHRGQAIGKCTYIDCCDPWRSGPKLRGGADWCTHREPNN